MVEGTVTGAGEGESDARSSEDDADGDDDDWARDVEVVDNNAEESGWVEVGAVLEDEAGVELADCRTTGVDEAAGVVDEADCARSGVEESVSFEELEIDVGVVEDGVGLDEDDTDG